jgi:acyl-CoA-binding protein
MLFVLEQNVETIKERKSTMKYIYIYSLKKKSGVGAREARQAAVG